MGWLWFGSLYFTQTVSMVMKAMGSVGGRVLLCAGLVSARRPFLARGELADPVRRK